VLTVRELVDLYGRFGFDVLCMTDHVVRSDDPCLEADRLQAFGVISSRYAAYLDEVDFEAERALAYYGMLVIPGLELSYNDLDPAAAAHAVAVGLRAFVGVDGGIDRALGEAGAAGAALIAAHPNPTAGPGGTRKFSTRRFAADESLRALVHRFELFNRYDLFSWVAEAGLPTVASGDFHRAEHLWGWKTLLPCQRSEQAVVSYLRSSRPAYLTRLDQLAGKLAA
jgi:hypothetical protein